MKSIQSLSKVLPLIVIAAILPFMLPGGRLGSYFMTLMILAVSYSIATLGLTVLLGYSGQISLAQAAFYGLGSYTVGILTVKAGWPFWLAAIVAIICPILFGIFLGMISLKLTTHYLALVTIGFQVILNLVFNNWTSLTKGADGISGIPRPSFFGFDLTSDQNYYWFILGCLCVVCFLVYRLKHSRLGRALLALREDELAADVAGINIFWIKVLAFAFSSAIGGIGGIIYAAGAGYISPNVYTFDQSVVFFSMALVGGSDSIIGTILGTVLLTFLPEFLRSLQQVYMAVYGLLVILVVIFLPDGIWGAARNIWQKVYKKKSKGAGGSVTHLDRLSFLSAMSKSKTQQKVLEVKNLHKHFGGVKAVNGIDFIVQEGDIAVLIGPNGSGKTTAINLLSGIYTPTDGEILFNGKNIAGFKPSDITKGGIARTFQNIRLFPELTVLENVMIGNHTNGSVGIIGTLLSRRKGFVEDQISANKALEALHFVGIDRIHDQAKNLPYGQQRLVEIARALVSEPKLLLLDEPAAGMNAEETEQLVKLIKKLNNMGLTILLIEHDMSLVSEVATRAYVMDFGRKISEGDIQTVLNDPIVIKAYLGEELEYDYA